MRAQRYAYDLGRFEGAAKKAVRWTALNDDHFDSGPINLIDTRKRLSGCANIYQIDQPDIGARIGFVCRSQNTRSNRDIPLVLANALRVSLGIRVHNRLVGNAKLSCDKPAHRLGNAP